MNSGDELLAQLQATEKGLLERLEKLRKPILQVEEDLNHIQGTIAFYRRNTKTADSTDALTAMSGNVSIHKGMTQVAAVVAIAKHFGGAIRAQDAKKIMIRAGVMGDTKNATNMTHNVILRSELFERIGPGEYRLKQTKTENEPAPLSEGRLFTPGSLQ